MEGGARVVHPAVEPLSYLIGKWKGTGEGGFPTISSFSYGEELTFTHPGNKVYMEDAHFLDLDECSLRVDCFGWIHKGAKLYAKELALKIPTKREKPVIAYSQKTWKLNSGEPMHAESGYWRPKPDGTIEVVIAQSTGLVEIQKGTYDAEKKEINLQSELVGNASKVKEISRVFTLVNEELTYVVEMAANLTSRQPHLKASLKKL